MATLASCNRDAKKAPAGQAVDVTDPVSFTDGALYFVDGSQITDRVQIITSGTPDNETTVSYTDLTTSPGVVIKNIKSNATNVYFVGNIPSSVTLPASGNISGVWSQLAGIETQSDITGGVVNVSLYGTGTVNPPSGLPTDPKEVAFQVYPIAARIQIPYFVIDPDAANVIDGFQVDGIFINNFYYSMALNGVPAAANKIAYTSTATWAPDGETYYGY